MPKPTIEKAPASTALQGELIRLTLDQLKPDPQTDVRMGLPPKDEDAQIDDLARSMFEQGQLQPLQVRKAPENGYYFVTFGRRRFAAAQLIEKQTGAPFPLTAILTQKSDDDAWTSAIYENMHRRNNSPIEFANLIMEVKKRKGFDGPDWTKGVGEFLHVSRATISQHAKLLTLPKSLQSKVHSGVFSRQSALDLMEAEETKRQEEVAARAEELAEEEERSKPHLTKAASGKASKAAADESTPQSAPKRGTPRDAEEAADEAEKGKVKRKHVLKAARELDTTTKPRTRGELLDFWSEVLESTDSYSDEVTEFASFYVQKYAAGQGTDRQLRNRLSAIDERISRRRKTA
jgi:ParB/RepB/Spo0J family partition protein